MYTKQDLINGITNEFRIIKHLSEKVTEENKDHQFTETQRTTNDLMFYLSYSLPKQVQIFVDGKMDPSTFADESEKKASFDYKNFDQLMDSQLENIISMINSLSDEQMEEEIEVFGRKQARKILLVEYVLVFLWAYKMQLFLQLKHSGLSSLNTGNLRAGMDR